MTDSLALTSYFAFDTDGFGGECSGGGSQSYAVKMLSKLVLPLVFAVSFVALHAIARAAVPTASKYRDSTRQTGLGGVLVAAAVNPRLCVAAFGVCIQLLYATLTTVALSPVSCTQLSNGSVVMDDAPDIECEGGEWAARILPLGMAATAAISVVLPALAGAALFWSRRRLNDQRTRELLGYLYQPYRPDMYWYGVVDVVGKFMFALAASLYGVSIQTRLGVLALIAGGQIFVQAGLRPFHDTTDNALLVAGTVLIILVLAVAPGAQPTISLCILAAFAVYVCVALVVGVRAKTKAVSASHRVKRIGGSGRTPEAGVIRRPPVEVAVVRLMHAEPGGEEAAAAAGGFHTPTGTHAAGWPPPAAVAVDASPPKMPASLALDD